MLLGRLADRSSSALHRTAAVRALAPLLHLPRGMALFVELPGGAAAATAAAADAGAAEDAAAAAPASGYQRVLRALATPLPGPMQQPVRAVCALVALWDAAVQLREACEQGLRVDSASLLACDQAAAPVLAALRKMGRVLGEHCAAREGPASPAHAASEGPASGSEASGLPPRRGPRLAPEEAQLLTSAGLWRSLAALLASPLMRRTSLLESLAAAIGHVLGALLESYGGALSLAAEPAAARLLHELLHAHAAAPAAPAAPAAQAGDVKPEVKPVEGAETAEGAEAGAAGAAGAASSWAAGLSRRVRESCRAVGALERLVRGEWAALHTLLGAPPSQTEDAVVVCLGSQLGLGVLSALLHSGGGRHAELAHYAARLLLRVLASPAGAALSVAHAHWVRDF